LICAADAAAAPPIVFGSVTTEAQPLISVHYRETVYKEEILTAIIEIKILRCKRNIMYGSLVAG
jgi:hypothetical protein